MGRAALGPWLSERAVATRSTVSIVNMSESGCDALTRAAMCDPAVHRLLAEVQQLLRPPSVLQDPAIDRPVQAELFQMAAE
jgi:hypothetical protein